MRVYHLMLCSEYEDAETAATARAFGEAILSDEYQGEELELHRWEPTLIPDSVREEGLEQLQRIGSSS